MHTFFRSQFFQKKWCIIGFCGRWSRICYQNYEIRLSKMADPTWRTKFAKLISILIKIGMHWFSGSLISNMILDHLKTKWRIQHGGLNSFNWIRFSRKLVCIGFWGRWFQMILDHRKTKWRIQHGRLDSLFWLWLRWKLVYMGFCGGWFWI